MWAGGNAQWLRAHIVLAKDPSIVPSTHVRQFTAGPSASGSGYFSHLLGHIYGHRCLHIEKL